MFILHTTASTSLLRMRQQLSSNTQQSSASPNNPDTSASTYKAIDNENPAIYSYPSKPSPVTSSGSFSNNNCHYQDPLEQGGAAPSSAGEDMLYHSVGPKVRQKEAGERSNKSGGHLAPPTYLPPINDAEQEGFYHALGDATVEYEDPTLQTFKVR